ncbi:MAG: site-specific integrase [Verrucomicrobia bacterium]|jgi:integrase|nr:site-specific integrase [Verrucomicrobiota bacterium]
MASTEKIEVAGRVRYAVRLSPSEDASRPRVRIGKVTKKQADTARTHVEQLIACKRTGSAMPPATQEWIASVDRKIRSRLEALGLLESSTGDCERKVGEWADECMRKRSDIKPRTRQNMMQARAFLMEFIGDDDLSLKRFTAGHAKDFRVFLLGKGQAEATVRGGCKRSKQFFASAICHGHITNNPFDNVATANVANEERLVFVDRATLDKVIEACPDDQWRLIFALARYGGLRIPSEIQRMRWDDIDWDRKRFTVQSPKTEHIEGKGHRDVPIFPELVQPLENWQAQHHQGESLVFPTLAKRSNLRAQAHRIIRKAGLQPWARVFQNLRASRETELVEEFPVHVVTDWIGNSPDIAKLHYLSVLETHFQRASEGERQKKGTYMGHTMASSGCQALTPETGDGSEVLEVVGVDSESHQAAICGKSPMARPRGVEPLLPG